MKTGTDQSCLKLIVVGGTLSLASFRQPLILRGVVPRISYKQADLANFSRIKNVIEIRCSAVTGYGIRAFFVSPSTLGSPSERYLTGVIEIM